MQENTTTYKIVLLGALPGVADAQAQAGFAKLFKLPPEKVEKVFAKPRRVLKTDLDREQAQKYVDKLTQVGVACEMLEEPLAQVAAAQDEPAARTDGGGDHGGEASAPPHHEPASGEPREVPFVFTGAGFEYFKIWIVNILLSIVTLGIYSAWAKVRNKQYFYGNTYLDDSSFSYTADPVKILIGRIIAFVFLVVYSVAGELSIVAGLIMGVLLFVFLPWVVCKSLRFNARYSSYRNVPFAFNGRLGGAALAYILWPLLGLITLGILMPYAFYQQKKFIYDNHGYGTTEFDFSATVGDYYKVCLLTLGIYIVAAGIGVIIGGLIHPVLSGLLAIAAYLFAFAYFTVAIANVNYNAIALKEHALSADWDVKEYLLLIVTNTAMIFVTLGLFIPWAKVRTAHFKARHTQAIFVGDIDELVADERDNVNALAESVGDLFDIEIGF